MKRRLGIAALVVLCWLGTNRAHAQEPRANANVNFTWDASQGANSYGLKCGAAAGGPYTLATKDFGNVLVGTIALPANVDSWCVVTAWISSDRPNSESVPSNEVKVRPIGQVPAPGNLRQVVTVTLYQDGTLETKVTNYEEGQPVNKLTWKTNN